MQNVLKMGKRRNMFLTMSSMSTMSRKRYSEELKESEFQKRRKADRGNAVVRYLHKKGKTAGEMIHARTRKRRAEHLSQVCSDAGVCMAFGKESDAIVAFFNNFDDFRNVSHPVTRIGAESKNGFVNKLTYTKYSYVAHAVLKSSVRVDTDNLMYEYYVGKFFINPETKRFPCFMETYGLYVYQSIADYDAFKTNLTNSPNLLHKRLRILDPTRIKWWTGCMDSKYLAVLIQYFANVGSLKEYLKDPYFVATELVHVLFQIYMPLAALRSRFTHYDLHTNNVLVYEPVKGGYIHYHYHNSSSVHVVEFKSRYIAKIIDYGRCYCKPVSSADSGEIHEVICGMSDCPACGVGQGFGLLRNKTANVKRNSYINGSICNQSHDLRLLHIVCMKVPSLFFGLGTAYKVHFEESHGTPEQLNSGLETGSINNVLDAKKVLTELLEAQNNANTTDIYAHYKKLGDLHIYNDGRPMQFIEF